MARFLLLVVSLGIGFAGFPGPRAEEHPQPDVIHTGPDATANAARALDKQVSMDLCEAPLHDVAQLLSKQASMRVLLDSMALDDLGMDSSNPITMSCTDMSLRATLASILRPLELEAVAAPMGIVVTSSEKAQRMLVKKVYPVHDLVPLNDAGRADELMEAFSTCIAPDDWEQVGGHGAMRWLHGNLIVSQTEAVHRQLREALQGLRQIRRESRHSSVVVEPDAELRTKLQEALQQPVDCDFHETPLEELTTWLSNELSVPIYHDVYSLDQVGLDSSEPITASFSNIRADHLLDWLLAPLDLRWTLQHEAIWITSTDNAEQNLYGVLYELDQGCASASEAADEFCDMVVAIVEPDSWEEVGGSGGIAILDGGRFLFIRQTHHVHEQIGQLFGSLQEAKTVAPQQNSHHDKPGKEMPVLQVYCVAKSPPTEAALPAISSDDLKSLIQRHVAPTSWRTGSHTIDTVPGRLLIRTTPAVHRRVLRLLEQLRLPVLQPQRPAPRGRQFGRAF